MEPVMGELPKFEFVDVLQNDIEEIFAARRNAQIIHHAKDIDAAGDEVEDAVRKVLRRKLPVMYYVGHGHIVDKQLTCSPQLDIIIANNTGAPVLFQAKNGSEYFPYETVYAIGEVKSGYYKSKHYIHEFSKQLSRIQSNLQRERNIVPPTKRGEAAYKNSLLSFMIFVQSNDFEIEHVVELYQTMSASELPNIVYFLDKGMIVNANIHFLGGFKADLEPLYTLPPMSAFVQYITNEDLRGKSGADVETDQGLKPIEALNHWAFVKFNDGTQLAANFGSFYFLLVTHLQASALTSPDLLRYLNHILGSQSMTIIF